MGHRFLYTGNARVTTQKDEISFLGSDADTVDQGWQG